MSVVNRMQFRQRQVIEPIVPILDRYTILPVKRSRKSTLPPGGVGVR